MAERRVHDLCPVCGAGTDVYHDDEMGTGRCGTCERQFVLVRRAEPPAGDGDVTLEHSIDTLWRFCTIAGIGGTFEMTPGEVADLRRVLEHLKKQHTLPRLPRG